mgnify:CR=1 FL=1
MKSKKTVILIPSYEPDPRLIELSKILSDMEFDVLIINDGSNESFNPIFEKAKEFAHLEGYKVNRGKGEAMKYGYTIIKEDYPDAKHIITCDGDGQHSPRDVQRIYETLEKENDLVFGVRYFGKEVPMRSKFGNLVSRIIRSTLTKQYIADDQCGLRGFPIRYLSDLIALEGSRYEYEMNQMVVFQLKQYRIVQLPIEVIYENGNPTSHFQVMRDTGRIHHAIFKHAWIPVSINLIALTMMYLMLIPNKDGIILPHVWGFIFSLCPMFFFSIGLTSLMYQTKNFPKRLLRETIFGLIKLTFGICVLLICDEIIHLSLFASCPIALFSAQMLNLFGSYLVGRINRPGKLRPVKK